jgi:hypothetical protein
VVYRITYIYIYIYIERERERERENNAKNYIFILKVSHNANIIVPTNSWSILDQFLVKKKNQRLVEIVTSISLDAYRLKMWCIYIHQLTNIPLKKRVNGCYTQTK